MDDEPESALAFRTWATLAALPVVYAVLLLVLPSLLPGEVLAMVGLDMRLAVGAVVPLLVVSGLMLERAVAARRGGGAPPE